MSPTPLVDTSVSADGVNLSDPEFWLAPRDYREHLIERAKK